MKMAIASPLFMGRGMADGEMKVGDSISHELSPLQAAHLIGVLVNQKFLDPHFQLPPEQWDRESHVKEMEWIREEQALSKSNPQVRLGAMARINPKRHALQDAISQNTNSMGIGDALDLIDSAFQNVADRAVNGELKCTREYSQSQTRLERALDTGAWPEQGSAHR